MFNRVILIVLDSVGVGAMPDAADYGDENSNTILHVYEGNENFHLDNLEKMGLTYIQGLDEIKDYEIITNGIYGRLMEMSKGKDTTTGHWEIAGLVSESSFPTYPEGFPDEVMDEFVRESGRGYLGNKPASGTAIIEELGREHMETGKLIVYTSADSVFQIAAHEDIVPLEELYDICKKARKMLKGKHGVGRVIARPFTGSPGSFERTENRRDYSLPPTGKTMLDLLKENGFDVVAIGKIEDIFAHVGITKALHTTNNADGIEATIDEIKSGSNGLIFTNLVDFDMLYGHRNNVQGYGEALKYFDSRLPEIIAAMKDDDLLMITADHGCDPSTDSTDHSREYVPLLCYTKNIISTDMKTMKGFNTIASTILDNFNIEIDFEDKSILRDLVRS
ncbi:phosphopentomutase [Dethiosulfatibacter aminovorans DSM 17477]|uniref:Phosphopentomutase n=1 Tax=Dethiosulfatibacter aminovorans DSM 17477 TaxID=1121476 RepID=A0A1M6DA41_9FIRM|nr:phosphopentomutase [Dethiosulfatibacter aminovorans]SHI69990.1 phosphopentomutase [Dethiosulfatibacter aminovorans DSM 17477]